MAQALECAVSWINALELGHYHGPARREWAAKYEAALDRLVAEKKAAR
jgi:hypothetical protein